MAGDDDILCMDPRPRDPSILHLQPTHRSSIVWEVGGGDNLRSRSRNPNNIKLPSLHPRMVPLLRDLRFDGISRMAGIQIDWGLITALVERWRPETHTFHFPIGECMISLQDVSVLLGLRIDGPPVTGFTAVKDGWRNYIGDVFGARPSDESGGLVGGRLKFTWLNSVFGSLQDDASDVQLRRYTQSYVLQLIGGVLFTDHSGNQVHCMYIPLIHDLISCGKLSWGSTVLAYLYMELCKSCKKDKEETAGCVLLLQLWAWSRLHSLAPVPRAPDLNNLDVWGTLPGPRGLRWCTHLSFIDSGSHSVAIYRLQLDVLADSHFSWQPYTDDILATLSQQCREDNNIWCYKGPLICFCFVEPHLPDRCLRQFGIIQDIPSSAAYSPDLHKINLKGKADMNWVFMHRDHIAHWDNREHHVFVGDVGVGVSDRYHMWYSSITHRYLTRIGGGHSFTLDLLDRIDLLHNEGRFGEVPAITAHARHVLQDKFASGYYQDYVEDRRAKEAVIRPKSKRGGRGGRGANAPRWLGERPVVDPGVHVDEEVEVQLDDNGGSVHLDDEGGVPVSETSAHVEDVRVGCHEAIAARERSFLPNWNLLPSNDPLPMSPLHDQAEINQTPPLSYPTFYLFTQSPSYAAKRQHSVQEPELQQEASVQPPVEQQPPLNQQQPPAQQQSPMNQQQPPSQHQPLTDQVPPAQAEQQHQQVPPAQTAHQQVPPVQAAQQLQQPAQREHIMQLRTRKHIDRHCGTNSKLELRPYKRRHLVKKYA